MDYWDFLKLKAENEEKIEALRTKHDREMRIAFTVLILLCVGGIIVLACFL